MQTVRLLIENDNITPNDIIQISNNDFDYLVRVMRLKVNHQLLVFNGINGEFKAEIIQINKKNCLIRIINQTQEQQYSSNITLAFCPVKNVRIDFVAAKATEMGVNKFQPIISQHSVVNKINEKRFLSNIKEACEQCERLDIPNLSPIIKLDKYLKNINNNQKLILCDESLRNNHAHNILTKINFKQYQEVIVFIGPEGGFSETEFNEFYKLENLNRISLGSRILRSDTAIISSLTLVNQYNR